MESIVIHGAFLVVLVLMFIYMWVLTERIDKLENAILIVSNNKPPYKTEPKQPGVHGEHVPSKAELAEQAAKWVSKDKPKIRKDRVVLSKQERLELYQHHLQHPSMKRKVLAAYYGIDPSTVSNIIKRKGY